MPLYAKTESNNAIAITANSIFLGKLCSSDRHEQLRQLLHKNGYQIRPKAIALTLFVRLFLADWFVHGIGGAKYERISDHIIRTFYKMSVPDFGIATATMALPDLEIQQEFNLNVSELKLKLRKIKFNPELFIDVPLSQKPQVRALLSDKRKLLVISRNKNLPSKARHLAWQSISKINQKLLPYVKDRYETLQKQLEAAENYQSSFLVKNHREFFFGLFPKSSLKAFVESVNK